MGLATPSPTPTTVAARKGTLTAISQLFDFILGGDVEWYETVESDSDSDSTWSVVSVIFAVGVDSGWKGTEKQDSDDGSDDGSRCLGETVREGWQEMAALCGNMTDAEDGRMVGFLLLVVSNICRIEPTQVFCLCCGLGNDCVAGGVDKIEMEAREVYSLADNSYIIKSELDDKQQEVGDLEEDVKELKKTVTNLEGEVRFQKKMREEDRKNSGTNRGGLFEPCWRDMACQATPVGVDKSVGAVAPVVDRKPRDVTV